MMEEEIIDDTEITLFYKCHACDEFIDQLDWQHFEKCSVTRNVALYCVCGFVFPIDQHYVYHCEVHRHFELYNSEDILVDDAGEFGEDVRNNDDSEVNEVCATNEEAEETEGHISVESAVREENSDCEMKDTEPFVSEYAVLGNASEVDGKKETMKIVSEVTEVENTKTCYDNDITLEVKIETTGINSITDLCHEPRDVIKRESQHTTNIEEDDDVEKLVEDETTKDNPLRTELKYEKYAVERDGETHKERDSTTGNADMVLHKPIEQELYFTRCDMFVRCNGIDVWKKQANGEFRILYQPEKTYHLQFDPYSGNLNEGSMPVTIPVHSDLTVSTYNRQQEHINPWSPTLVGFGASSDDLQYAVNVSPRREAKELCNNISKYKGMSNQVHPRQHSSETNPRPRTTGYSWLSVGSTWEIRDAGMASQTKSAEAALVGAREEDSNTPIPSTSREISRKANKSSKKHKRRSDQTLENMADEKPVEAQNIINDTEKIMVTSVNDDSEYDVKNEKDGTIMAIIDAQDTETTVECQSITNEANGKVTELLENESIANDKVSKNNTILDISELQIEIDNKFDFKQDQKDVVFITCAGDTTIEDNTAKSNQSHIECDNIDFDREYDKAIEETSVKTPTEVINNKEKHAGVKSVSAVKGVNEIGDECKRMKTIMTIINSKDTEKTVKANDTIEPSIGNKFDVPGASESQIEIDRISDLEHREQDNAFVTPIENSTIEDNIAKTNQSQTECHNIDIDRKNDQTSVKMLTEVDNFEKNNTEEKNASAVESIEEIGEESKRKVTKPTNEVTNGKLIESLENTAIENEDVSNTAPEDLGTIELVNPEKPKNDISDPRSKTDNNNDLEHREEDLSFSVLTENITTDDANEDIAHVVKHYKEDESVQSIDELNEAPENTTKEISDKNESRNGDKYVDLENENSEIDIVVAPGQDLTNEDCIPKIKARNTETDTHESVIEIEQTSVETSVEVIIIERNEKENKILNVIESTNIANAEKGNIMAILHDQQAEITVLSVSPCNEKDNTNIENVKSSEEEIIENEENPDTQESEARQSYESSNEENSELLGTSELHINKNINGIIKKDPKLVKCDVEDEIMNDYIQKAKQNRQINCENKTPESDMKCHHMAEQALSKTTEEEHVNETKETEEKVIRETVSVTKDKNELRIESERNETIFTKIFNLIFKKSIENLDTANGECEFDSNKEMSESKYIDNTTDTKVSEEVTDSAMEETNTIEQVSGEGKVSINSEIDAETICYTNDQDESDEPGEDKTVDNKITIINETVERIHGKATIEDNKDKEFELNAAIAKQMKHNRRRRGKKRKKIMKYIRKILLILGLIGIIIMLCWWLYGLYQKPRTILKTIHYEVSISNMYMYF